MVMYVCIIQRRKQSEICSSSLHCFTKCHQAFTYQVANFYSPIGHDSSVLTGIASISSSVDIGEEVCIVTECSPLFAVAGAKD